MASDRAPNDIAARTAAEAGYFGRIDLSVAPKPIFTRTRATVADPRATPPAAAPVYLHVRPGEQERWNSHCAAYAACQAPVFFVTEAWYRGIYLPRIGGSDGREQRYLDTVRFERADRDAHHRAEDE